jgi:HSP20 family protein
MNEVRTTDPLALDPFESVFRNMMRPWRGEAGAGTPQIRVDVHEDDKAYTVKADIPGVKREDIDVRIDGNLVTLSAEVKRESEEKKDGRVLRSERQYGYASRSFALAQDVQENEVEARYTDGVLTLRLPKKAQSGARKIRID